jgi:hypothetical protein
MASSKMRRCPRALTPSVTTALSADLPQMRATPGALVGGRCAARVLQGPLGLMEKLFRYVACGARLCSLPDLFRFLITLGWLTAATALDPDLQSRSPMWGAAETFCPGPQCGNGVGFFVAAVAALGSLCAQAPQCRATQTDSYPRGPYSTSPLTLPRRRRSPRACRQALASKPASTACWRKTPWPSCRPRGATRTLRSATRSRSAA